MSNRLSDFKLDNIRRYQLDNGLTVILRSDPTVPVVTCMTWYRAGSRLDPKASTGVAHFLEHMMFKGTKRFRKGEIDNLTAKKGGFNNGFTSYDFTAFCFSFASDRWCIALELEADRMINGLFDPVEFELERQVILEELRMEMDHPWNSLRNAIARDVFTDHPYRYPVAGLIEHVKSLRIEQIAEFYRRFYLPNNAFMTLVGDLDFEQTMEKIECLFGQIQSEGTFVSKDLTPPVFGSQSRLKIPEASSVSRMMLAFPAPAFELERFAVLEVLDQLLTGGKLSRLQRRLIEEDQLVSLLVSEYAESLDPYLYWLRMELKDGVESSEVEEVIFSEIERIGSAEISPEELERARTRSLVQFIGGVETTFDQAFQLGITEVMNQPAKIEEYSNLIQSVTTEAVSALVRSAMNRQNSTMAILERKDF